MKVHEDKTPECFDAGAPKPKLAAETFHFHSFVVLLTEFFLMWQFKILIECF